MVLTSFSPFVLAIGTSSSLNDLRAYETIRVSDSSLFSLWSPRLILPKYALHIVLRLSCSVGMFTICRISSYVKPGNIILRPFLDYLYIVRQIFRQVCVLYRTSIFNYWSDHRYINSNQIDLIDSSTFPLIDHIHPFLAFATISSTCAFQLKSDDIVTPITFAWVTLSISVPFISIYGRDSTYVLSLQKHITISFVLLVLMHRSLLLDHCAIMLAESCMTHTLLWLHISNIVLSSTYL